MQLGPSLVRTLAPLALAAAASAQSTYRASYDFNGLVGSDAGTHVSLGGQDGWVTTPWASSVPIGVTQSLGFDGTQCLRYAQSGSGVGCDASRLDDAQWALPAIDGGERDLYFQADAYVGLSGNTFGLAADVDGSGYVTQTDADELGPRLTIGSQASVQLRLYRADDTYVQVPLATIGVSGNQWVRLRLVMDLDANVGSGAGSVHYLNLSSGDTSFSPVPGLQAIDLALDRAGADASDPTRWDALFVHFEGATNMLDDFVVRRSLRRYDFDQLAASDSAPHTPLDGQDGWRTTPYNTAVDAGVTLTLTSDGSQGLSFAQVGPGVGVDASRVDDGQWALPDFAGNETEAYFQAEAYVGYWGNTFGLATDADGSGDVRKTDAAELGPRIVIGSQSGVQLRLYRADDTFVQVPISSVGATGGQWVRLRMVLDLTANAGAGAASLEAMNLSNGDTVFTPVAGLQGIGLALTPGSADGSDPSTWNALFVHFEGATNRIDDLEVATTLCGADEPLKYCTAGTTTNGCNASMSAFGTPHAGASSGFALVCDQVEGQKTALVFYGLSGRNNVPWGIGGSSLLCVKAPTQRTNAQNAGGTVGQCDGRIALDLSAWMSANPGALGTPGSAGQVFDAQCWFRDPPAPKTTNLSDAVEWALCP